MELLGCPSCGGLILEAVGDGEQSNFLCSACGSCWHFEPGYRSPVEPFACGSCMHQADCMAKAA